MPPHPFHSVSFHDLLHQYIICTTTIVGEYFWNTGSLGVLIKNHCYLYNAVVLNKQTETSIPPPSLEWWMTIKRASSANEKVVVYRR